MIIIVVFICFYVSHLYINDMLFLVLHMHAFTHTRARTRAHAHTYGLSYSNELDNTQPIYNRRFFFRNVFIPFSVASCGINDLLVVYIGEHLRTPVIISSHIKQ